MPSSFLFRLREAALLTSVVLIGVMFLPPPIRASADDYKVFNLTAALQSGEELNGLIALDLSNNTLAHPNVQQTSVGAPDVTAVDFQNSCGASCYQAGIFTSDYNNEFYIILPQANLVSYDGGEIVPTSSQTKTKSGLLRQLGSAPVFDPLVSGRITLCALCAPGIYLNGTTNISNTGPDYTLQEVYIGEPVSLTGRPTLGV